MHNSQLLKGDDDNTIEAKCNCLRNRKDDCPLPGECTVKGVIYEADVTTQDSVMKYTGSTGNTFKRRWYGHMESFRKRNKRNSTELSRYVWSLKDLNIPYKIKWGIVWRTKTKSKPTAKGLCVLCNMERITIANANRTTSLNKRSELVGKCRHYQTLYFNAPDYNEDPPD